MEQNAWGGGEAYIGPLSYYLTAGMSPFMTSLLSDANGTSYSNGFIVKGTNVNGSDGSLMILLGLGTRPNNNIPAGIQSIPLAPGSQFNILFNGSNLVYGSTFDTGNPYMNVPASMYGGLLNSKSGTAPVSLTATFSNQATGGNNFTQSFQVQARFIGNLNNPQGSGQFLGLGFPFVFGRSVYYGLTDGPLGSAPAMGFGF